MNKEQEILGEKIMNYLRKNPHAGDTRDGITNWWLEQEPGKGHPPVHHVANALEVLARKGMIRKRLLPGGIELYRATEDRGGGACKRANVQTRGSCDIIKP